MSSGFKIRFNERCCVVEYLVQPLTGVKRKVKTYIMKTVEDKDTTRIHQVATDACK